MNHKKYSKNLIELIHFIIDLFPLNEALDLVYSDVGLKVVCLLKKNVIKLFGTHLKVSLFRDTTDELQASFFVIKEVS